MKKMNEKRWAQKILFKGNLFAHFKILRIVHLTVLIFILSQIQVIAAETLSLNNRNETVEQQQITVSGRVIDQAGLPLPGVTILIMGTTQGVVTNVDGQYSLSNVQGTATLQFSFVGMTTQEIPIAGQSVINVTMVQSSIGLEEVVAVGYGVQRKETMTGSISKVGGEEILKSPSVNVATSLQGKLPGLVINQRSGNPGNESLDIVIRGTSTFNDNSPLVVIDGVPRKNTLQQLNPEDIESVTVLKDASAAIYGARAANGVILVTTKSGITGPTKFSVTYNYAINEPTQLPEMMGSPEFAEVFNEAAYYDQGRPDMSVFVPKFSDAEITKFRDGSDPVSYPNTNWMKETTKKYGTQQNVTVQARGGSEKIKYLLSFGTINQLGNFKNRPDEYKRYNSRVNVTAELTKNLTIGVNVSGNISDRNSQNSGINDQSISSRGTTSEDEVPPNAGISIISPPTLVAVYPNGLLAPGRFRGSPLLSSRYGFNNFKNSTVQSTFTATYKVPFVEGLILDASYNYDFRNQFQKNFTKPAMYHEYNTATGEYDQFYTLNPVQLMDTYSTWTTALSNFRISYETTIAENHNIKLMGGTEQQTGTFSYANAYRKNFVSTLIPEINVGSTDPTDLSNGGSSTKTAYNNFFGRLNYNFKSKYLLEALFRYDGSPIFPKNNRYGFFPAVSVGWRISEESFMAGMSFLDELKLRGSYGETGNDRVGAFQYLQAFQFGQNYVFGGKDAPGIYSSRLPNPDITWEVAKKMDFGVDAILWNRLLGLEFSVFNEKRSNILLQRNLSVPTVAGFPALPDQNFGEVTNRGFELNLTHQNTIRELTYSVVGNISYAKSKIIFMDEVPPAEDYQANTGMTLGSALYYKSDGIFNTQAEYDAYPHRAGDQVGDIKIVDLNKDGVINGLDRYRNNNSRTPELVFGLTTNFEYKGFSLSLFFQGQARAYRYEGSFTDLGKIALDNQTVYRATNRWTINNQEGATMPRSAQYTSGDTDFYLYDATFVRLKNAELSYSLGNNLTKKIGLDNIRIFVSGTNLLTWAKDIKWSDPEASGTGSYPPLRVINFGINVNF